MPRSRSLLLVAALLAVTGVSIAAKTRFESVWKSPDAATTTFAGKKVAALVIDNDDSLRVAGEEALVRELTARGINGVPSYRMMPKELAQDPAQAKAWYEKAGVEGVVALRVVDDQRRKTIVPGTWTSGYYTSFWGYYGYSYSAVFTPGYTRNERIVSLETLIFDVPKNTLVWAGLSVTDNPKDGQKVVTEVVKEAVSEMRKQGLAKK